MDADATSTQTCKILLLAYRLADRFQADEVSKVLKSALDQVQQADVHTDLISLFFCLQPSVRESLGDFEKKCTGQLVSIFGDVPAVIRSPDLTAQFISLPQAAALVWVQQDGLTVHSENCVVYLLMAWVNENKSMCKEQLKELVDNVRAVNLSTSYLVGTLPTLEFFGDCKGMRYITHLLHFKAGTEIDMAMSWPRDGPTAWIKGSRTLSPEAEDGVAVELSLTPAEITSSIPEHLIDNQEWLIKSSPPLYFNGYWIQPALMGEWLSATTEVREGRFHVWSGFKYLDYYPYNDITAAQGLSDGFKATLVTKIQVPSRLTFKILGKLSFVMHWSKNFYDLILDGPSDSHFTQLFTPYLINDQAKFIFVARAE